MQYFLEINLSTSLKADQTNSDSLQPKASSDTSNSLIAMASNLVAIASKLTAMASKLIAMASNRIAMVFNLIGLQPSSDGL